MSDHSIEYHRTWAAFFGSVVALAVPALIFTGVVTHKSHVADLKYTHDEMVICIQSDRPAADCRLIVHGSK